MNGVIYSSGLFMSLVGDGGNVSHLPLLKGETHRLWILLGRTDELSVMYCLKWLTFFLAQFVQSMHMLSVTSDFQLLDSPNDGDVL